MSMTPPTPPLQNHERRPADTHWLERHWWKVLIALVVGGGLMVVVCCGGLVFVVFGSLRSNDVVDMTVTLLDQEPRVIEHTGHPISAGWFVMGNINWHNDQGDASLRIPVQGPQGQVEAIVDAERKRGEWQIIYLRVVIDPTGEAFTLIDRDATEGTP